MMASERWQIVEDVFQTAVDLAVDARPQYLAETCADDPELRSSVEALITRYEEAGEFMESPASGHSLTTALLDETDPLIGRRVGAYEIEREIGRGGMGAVYLAARVDGEERTRVAVKLIKRGMDTDYILRRFRNERRILSRLDHPNIARLLDGGATEDGRPYFVMEFVAGQPLYHYCDARRLTVRDRLLLFRQICGAAHYAHQSQVIHRDIKPSNILVGADGAVKLLDFGIAKLLAPAAEIETATLTAMRVMTPQYASPEQAQGLTVTFVSDVYSLGALLYELLTGRRPYRFTRRLPHEIARAIREQEPQLPSLAAMLGENILPISVNDGETVTLESPGYLRRATPEGLSRELAGGLDSVIFKAMRKDAAERYQSAEELSEDIARWLAGQPVAAPARIAPTALLAGGATEVLAEESAGDKKVVAVLPFKLLAAVVDGDTGDNYLSVGLADALIARLSHVQRFVVRPTGSVLRYSQGGDPFVAGRELGADFALDGLIKRAGGRIRVSAQLLNVRERATVWAGQFDENFTDVLSVEDAISARVAEAILPQLTGDERQRLAKRGTDNAEAFESYLRGRYYWSTFSEEGLAKALIYFQRAVALDPHYAAAYTGIADYYNWLGVYGVMPFSETSAAAKAAATRAVELDEALAEGWSALGFATLCRDFDWRKAEKQHQRALALNPNYATGRSWYAFQLTMEGRFDEALGQARRAIEIDHLSPANHYHLAWCAYYARRFDEGLAIYRRLAITDPNYAPTWFGLSRLLRRMGEAAESVEIAEKTVEMSGRTPIILSNLAASYAAAGMGEQARQTLDEIGALAAERYVSPYHLAIAHCHLDDKERALELLEEARALGDAWVVWLGVEPQFDPLRADPRYIELMHSVGLHGTEPRL